LSEQRNTFRKTMWIERDLAQCAPILKLIHDTVCDPESLMLAPILCAMASPKFTPK